MSLVRNFDQSLGHGESFRYVYQTADGSPLTGVSKAAISSEDGLGEALAVATITVNPSLPASAEVKFSQAQILSLPVGRYLFDHIVTWGEDSKRVLIGIWTIMPGASY